MERDVFIAGLFVFFSKKRNSAASAPELCFNPRVTSQLIGVPSTMILAPLLRVSLKPSDAKPVPDDDPPQADRVKHKTNEITPNFFDDTRISFSS